MMRAGSPLTSVTTSPAPTPASLSGTGLSSTPRRSRAVQVQLPPAQPAWTMATEWPCHRQAPCRRPVASLAASVLLGRCVCVCEQCVQINVLNLFKIISCVSMFFMCYNQFLCSEISEECFQVYVAKSQFSVPDGYTDLVTHGPIL
jgi:hypothetical protein